MDNRVSDCTNCLIQSVVRINRGLNHLLTCYAFHLLDRDFVPGCHESALLRHPKSVCKTEQGKSIGGPQKILVGKPLLGHLKPKTGLKDE